MSTAEAEEVGETVRVELGARGYDIVIGEGLLAALGAQMRNLGTSRRAAIVTDESVARLYLEPVRGALEAAGYEAPAVQVAPGEGSKNFATLERVTAHLLDLGVERGDFVVALGGGVIGDLAGFAAAILRRGIGFVQCPTTLLAQVDSAVGGKTGINMPQGKNLVGAFHQPAAVLSDLAALDTLPVRERRSGYAEIIKYGLIDRPDFFAWLEAKGGGVLAGERAAQSYAVAESCRAKAAIVAADEREAGNRALLNLGHTFGHALETATGYDGSLLHGEAVALGCLMAFELSARLGLAPASDTERLARHLEAVELPTRLPDGLRGTSPEALVALMAQDKKVSGGRLTFVLARGIGHACLSRDVPHEALIATLTSHLAP